MTTTLVTGSSGLIGSEAVVHFDRAGHSVHGIDNNMRRQFFGEKGDTTWNLERLVRSTRNFHHHGLDIRDRDGVAQLFPRKSGLTLWFTAPLNRHMTKRGRFRLTTST